MNNGGGVVVMLAVIGNGVKERLRFGEVGVGAAGEPQPTDARSTVATAAQENLMKAPPLLTLLSQDTPGALAMFRVAKAYAPARWINLPHLAS
jgi:hypothetical protein